MSGQGVSGQGVPQQGLRDGLADTATATRRGARRGARRAASRSSRGWGGPRSGLAASADRRSLIDLGVVSLLLVIALLGFAPVLVGGWFLVAALVGLVVGVAAGWLSRVLGLSAILTALLALVLYFLLGTPAAIPGQAILGVLPSLGSLRGLAVGAVFGWSDVLTLSAPAAAPDYLLVLPYVSAWLTGLVTAVLALRWLPRGSRSLGRVSVLLIAPVVLYLATVVLGTDDPFLAAGRGTAFAVVALVWLGWRNPFGRNASLQDRSTLARRKLVGTAVIVASAIAAGTLGTVAIEAPLAESRFVLREVVQPPFDPVDYPSPLAGFRNYTADLDETILFTVDGLVPGDQLRLATMDTYTGRLWDVAGVDVATNGSGSFRLVGGEFPEPDLFTRADARSLDVTVQGYTGVWLPGVGAPSRLEVAGADTERTESVRFNAATSTTVLMSRLSEGDEYTLTSGTQAVPSDDALQSVQPAQIAMPPIVDSPDVVTAKMAEYIADAQTPIEQVRAIETALHTNGFLSHGLASDSVPSRAGHGADRIEELFTRNQMIGDQEQFAAAMALMVRQLGFPARVVMGFAPENVVEGQPTEVMGGDVTAWVEVPFEGVGWIPFYPTPDETEIPQDQNPKPQTEPQPQVRQPPRVEKKQEDLLTSVDTEDGEDEEKDDAFVFPAWIVYTAIGVAAPFLILGLWMLVIALLKSARRRRRRRAAEGHERAVGAWDELIDGHAELGFAVPPNQTRTATASSFAAQRSRRSRGDEGAAADPAVMRSLRDIAARADEAVFAGGSTPVEDVDALWQGARREVTAAGRGVGWWRRLRSRLRISRAGASRSRRAVTDQRRRRGAERRVAAGSS
jgi:transglutaminase-like putative cysteine protease